MKYSIPVVFLNSSLTLRFEFFSIHTDHHLSNQFIEIVDDDRRIIGLVRYEHKSGASSSFTDPSIELYAPDDYRNWRIQNPEPKNICCFLPISVHIELSFRQLFVTGFDIIDTTPEKIVMPRDISMRCRPLSDKELFYLDKSYGKNGDRIPKFNKKEVIDFIGLIGSARYQFAMTHLVKGGKCYSMFNIADLSDQYVVQNIREFPDDAIQEFDVFSAYKRIRHAIVSSIENFQTDQYLVQNGTLVGIFYDLNTNPTHSKTKLITNAKLNLISNRFKSEISGTFLDLPNNHRNRLELDICGHRGHKTTLTKQLPKPVSIRGASIWDVSNHLTPSPVYRKSPQKSVKDPKSNTTIFGRKLWGKSTKKLFSEHKIVDIDLSLKNVNKSLKKVTFTPEVPPIQVFQALTSDSSKTLDLSADVENNPAQTDIPNPVQQNTPIADLNTSIDYQNPMPGPSNRSPTGRHQPVSLVPNVIPAPQTNIRPETSTTPNLTTYSDFFNNWRLTFVYKGPNMPTVNESNRTTNQSEENWVNVLGDLHRFQSQFKNQFQQLLKEYQSRIISTSDNSESLVPDPSRAILMMNEINMLARSINSNSSNFERLRDHITNCVFGIVSTFYSSEINRPNIDPVDFSNFSVTPTLINEILAYLDNTRDSLMNLRPFPSSSNSNHTLKETKMLKALEDFHNEIKPFLDAIVQKFEATKNEIDTIVNAPGSSASNTPNVTPPNQSTQKSGKDGNFEFKSDTSSPNGNKTDNDPNQGPEKTNRDQTIPADVLNPTTSSTSHNSNVSRLPSSALALLDSTNVQPSKDPSVPSAKPEPARKTSNQNNVPPPLEEIEEIHKSPGKPTIVPVAEILDSPEPKSKSKKKSGRFTISSESDSENVRPPTRLNRSNVASRTRKRTADKAKTPAQSKRKRT